LLTSECFILQGEIQMDTFFEHTRAALRSSWMIAAAALTLGGCGSSGDSADTNNPPASDTGTLLVSVTDADGDFVSYSVDVLSVTLQRRSGAEVEVLPAATRIDFAQLTDLSDLLAVASLAPVEIVGGTIRLDYSTAEVFVESAGEVVRAAVVGEDGSPLGITQLDIELAANGRLLITRARAALLALDFDLAASHEVDLSQSPPIVTTRPYIVAEIEPVAEKELRLRGALVATDTAAGSYTVDVRPWFRPDGAHGRVTVHTTASTSFEIDGAPATGAAGLAALAAKPAGTMTVAFGTLSTQDRRFTAEIVHAGDSVSGERVDAIHGNIVARSGDQLTVKGAFAVSREHEARLHRTVLVDVGPGTAVLKTGSPGTTLDASALSVGQHIVAFGEISEPASDAVPATFDATAGRVRMLPTHIRGAVTAVAAGQVNLDVRAIDRLGVELFDFTGTGTSSAQDADAGDYEVLTGTLGLANLVVGEAARIVGFVRPFGSAPADFEGRTVIDYREPPALLGIGWGSSGTMAPFLSMGSTGLVLDLDNRDIGARHTLVLGGRHVDLLTLATAPTITAPAAGGRALYGISSGGDVRLFTTFAEFSTELAFALSGRNALVALTASGSYDETGNTLHATHVAAHFAGN
jgi:hypothetical protein